MQHPTGLALILVTTLMACGGGAGDDAGDDTPSPDAAPDAPSGPCDPVAQTGCGDGEKCAWINYTDDLGAFGCVPAGPVGVDEACAWGPTGEDTGYDDCEAGLVCTGGLCHEACTASQADSCDHAEDFCHPVLLGTYDIGACFHRCDAVTQVRELGNAAACGSTDPSNPNFGCYKANTTELCYLVPPEAQGRTQDDTAYGPTPTTAYLNGCAPGYGVLPTFNAGLPNICVAFCRPTETSAENQAGSEGLPGSGYTCSDRGAAGRECRFFWFFEGWEGDYATGTDNDVGLCWTPGDFVYDWDNDAQTAATGAPPCTSLSTADTDGDGVADNKQYGCAPY